MCNAEVPLQLSFFPSQATAQIGRPVSLWRHLCDADQMSLLGGYPNTFAEMVKITKNVIQDYDILQY